jgi:hypothetical protein
VIARAFEADKVSLGTKCRPALLRPFHLNENPIPFFK